MPRGRGAGLQGRWRGVGVEEEEGQGARSLGHTLDEQTRGSCVSDRCCLPGQSQGHISVDHLSKALLCGCLSLSPCPAVPDRVSLARAECALGTLGSRALPLLGCWGLTFLIGETSHPHPFGQMLGAGRSGPPGRLPAPPCCCSVQPSPCMEASCVCTWAAGMQEPPQLSQVKSTHTPGQPLGPPSPEIQVLEP